MQENNMQEQVMVQDAQLGRKTRWSARQIAIMGLFAAIGIALTFIKTPPLFLPFLTYDAANVPAILGGIAYGPGLGTVVGVIIHGIHALFSDDFLYGALMNIPALLAYMLPVAILCRKDKSSNTRLIGGLLLGSLLAVIVMIAMNLIVTPIFMGVPVEAVVGMIVPALIPFNLIKVAINSVLTFLLYKSLQKVLK